MKEHTQGFHLGMAWLYEALVPLSERGIRYPSRIRPRLLDNGTERTVLDLSRTDLRSNKPDTHGPQPHRCRPSLILRPSLLPTLPLCRPLPLTLT